MMDVADAAGFRLSRIYAQGWNTARTLEGAQHANPYPADPERGCWQVGFADAQRVDRADSTVQSVLAQRPAKTRAKSGG
jgi:hypothetical protein